MIQVIFVRGSIADELLRGMTFLGSRQEVSEIGTVLLAPIKAITVVKTCFHALLWGRPRDINPGNVCVPTDDGATLNV